MKIKVTSFTSQEKFIEFHQILHIYMKDISIEKQRKKGWKAGRKGGRLEERKRETEIERERGRDEGRGGGREGGREISCVNDLGTHNL